MQAGDVMATEADTSALEELTGFKPKTPVEEGVRRFVEWYREYYKV
jgi:UDP-glucuronate 4-epimerase